MRRITIWSVLALIVALLGATVTLITARSWVGQWAASGAKYSIGEWVQVYVPETALTSLVYYESTSEVGSRFMRLYVRDVYGEAYPPTPPEVDNEFAIGGLQGRALFRLDLLEPGTYDMRCVNPNYASDEEIPASDRVVFLKTPNTKSEVLRVRKAILAAGGSGTILATLLLYILHGISIHRHRGADRDEFTTIK